MQTLIMILLMTGNGEDSEQDNADGEQSDYENGESPLIGDDTKWCKPLIRIMLMTGKRPNAGRGRCQGEVLDG